MKEGIEKKKRKYNEKNKKIEDNKEEKVEAKTENRRIIKHQKKANKKN